MAPTFLISPRWFVYNLATSKFEDETEAIRWPDIRRYVGHDLYVGLAANPEFVFIDPDNPNMRQHISLALKQKIQFGQYTIGYFDHSGVPGKYMGVRLAILKPDGTPVEVDPKILMGSDEKGPHMDAVDYAVPELRDEHGVPGVARLDKLDPGTYNADISLSLPGANTTGVWVVHAEVTYKPWVNLVWAGVLIAVCGIFLAGINRSLEARKISDGPTGHKGASTSGSNASEVADNEDDYPGDLIDEEAEKPAPEPTGAKPQQKGRQRQGKQARQS